MVSKEMKYQCDSKYMIRHPDLQPKMRAILLDWIIEVGTPRRPLKFVWCVVLRRAFSIFRSAKFTLFIGKRSTSQQITSIDFYQEWKILRKRSFS